MPAEIARGVLLSYGTLRHSGPDPEILSDPPAFSQKAYHPRVDLQRMSFHDGPWVDLKVVSRGVRLRVARLMSELLDRLSSGRQPDK